ncbi:MAG: InlB B-repeat-containing protein, partial [Firmicutes bacterium]|nr:InlB B-repeat-containing protein [Bacillota bacterium]
MQTKSAVKKGISFLLCFFLILAYSVGPFSAMHVDAAVDVGSNPTPKIDIAVNVPSDYPGTFLDFKNELTQKLIEQGLEPGSFRITDTKVSIDTTDLNGWYVYDHYYDQTRYNNLNLSAEQKLKQPYRAADNSYTTGGIVTMESLLKNGNISGCRNFTQHIWSYADEHGKASMVFAGYGTQPYVDYMIYPAASDSRRTISFDIDANAIGPHTLSYYGFLLNAGIENGRLKGYVLNFNQSHAGSITKVDLDQNFSGALGGSVVAGSSMNMGLSSTKKARVTVELNKDKVSVQVQQYDTSGNLSAPQTKLNGVKLENTGFNGFGPIVGYASHGCSELTVFRYLDLEMSYETSAFDALKNIQYYQGAEYKYFINLAGDSGDPGIPLETDPGYQDGINRMNQNDIFYISNADDGRVVTDTTKDENGNPTHQGLGSKNGYIAQGDDYASMMAQYIAKNYTEGVKFTKNEVLSDLPLASFFVKDAATEKSQIMTIHLRHLYNTGETVSVNMYDKSKPGLNATKKDPNAKITQWHYKIYDPKNNVQYDSGWVNDVNKIKDYVFTKDSMSGRWTFELTVRDSEGESKTFQTYATAFWDDKAPIIQGENTSKNKATITLTDTGMGIDEDGITFIEDDRGSGVAAYWITNSTSETPSDSDWIYLDEVQHSYAFDYEITSTEPLVVWVKDECKNVGKQMVFQPIHIVVEDENGNPIDDYYVLDEPIVILPEEVPEPEDPDDAFSGWVVPGGGGSTPEPSKPMTPGTIPEDNDDHTIVIRPSYSKDKANIVYVANGGTVHTSAGDKPMSNSYAVTAGASIETKIEDHNVKPTRVGYSFAGWKLLNSNNADDAVNEAYINNTANLADVEKTVAECHTDKDTLGEHLEDTAVVHKTYYLIAQWKIGNYTLNLDTNGGSYGNMRNIPDVAYGTNIGNLGLPTSGRGIPTKPGYIFQGWSENSGNNSGSNFKPVAGVTASATAPTMPASDKTVYAVWKADSSKFVVTFDTDGGNKIKDQAYQTSTATNYQEIPTPTKAGYTFTGWKIVNEDGSLGEAAVSKGVLLKKENHTLKAVWEANTDTPYAVDYYINSGNKDANGNFIYTKANGYTRDYTGTTEEVVQIPEADKLSEITVDGADYWLDKGNANEVLSGAITGNPTLSLKLYYNRYFNVTVTGDADKGTFTSATKQLEGATPTVSWQAKEGYHVAKILVDGKIRDDLLNATSYTLEEGIHANHTVQVVLESGAENPDMPKPNYYQVTTSILGCTDGTCTITDTMRVRPGESAKVEWNVPAERGWNITKILVDGQELADLTVGAVEMDRIAADHSVVVFVS